MATLRTAPVRPLPHDPADVDRWEYTALVRRVLYGLFQDDVRRRLVDEVGTTRAHIIKHGDISHNVLNSLCNSLSQSYVRPPIMSNAADASALIGPDGALARAGYFALMPRFMRDLLGMREMFMCVSVSDGELVLRPVSPDNVVAIADPNNPSQPIEVAELRLRHVEGHGMVYCYDVYSIGDVPVYRIVAAGGDSKGKDLTEAVLGTGPMVGPAYPFVNAEGMPIIPLALYHAEATGKLFDPHGFGDLVDGTLNICTMMSFLRHTMRAASWPQRVSIGLSPVGLSPSYEGRTREVVTDPSTLLQLEPIDGFEGQPFLHQFSTSASLSDYMDVISRYMRGLVSAAGVSAADYQRVTGDPRSGYALSLTREGLREQQRKYEPNLQAGDTQLLEICAIMLNRHSEAMGQPLNLPESGYDITYQGVPKTSDEIESEQKQTLELMDAGLLSRLDAYMKLNPGVTKDEAVAALNDIDGLGSDSELEQTVDTDSVLNGAQVTAAQGIVTSVAAGQLPRESGINMLVEFFGITEQAASNIMGTVGQGFEPTPQE